MTEADLRAAIGAKPDDDELKLVYADWLMERGDERGEYIRLSIAKHTRDARALLERHAEWHGGLRPGWVTWARGFIIAATLDREAHDWPAIFARHPLLRTIAGVADEIATVPGERWHEVRLQTLRGVEAPLVARATWPSLRRLAIRYSLDEPAAIAIAGADWFPRLEQLAFGASGLSQTAAAAIAGRGTSIRALTCRGVSPVGMLELARLPALESLDVGDERYGDAELAAIAAIPRLRRLELGGRMQISDAAAQRLAAVPGLELVVNDAFLSLQAVRMLGGRVGASYLDPPPPTVGPDVDWLRAVTEAISRWGPPPVAWIGWTTQPKGGFKLLVETMRDATGEMNTRRGWPELGRQLWPQLAAVAIPKRGPANLVGKRFGELPDPFTPLVEWLARRPR